MSAQMNAEGEILVINPNSNAAVTRGIDEATAPLRLGGAPAIRCVTLEEGPFGIESEEDAAHVVPLLERIVAEQDSDAYVIACFSDPGLDRCREISSKPVFGIAQCGLAAALSRVERVGVLSILEDSLPRHAAYFHRLGLASRVAGDRAVGMTVAETEASADAFDRLVAVADALRKKDGAEAIVLGCTGMARHQRDLEEAVGCPVVEPSRAAVSMAVTALL